MALKRLTGGYLTVVGAVVTMLVLGWLVHRGVLTPYRVIVPLVFAWMFALHALDYKLTAEAHARAVIAASKQAV